MFCQSLFTRRRGLLVINLTVFYPKTESASSEMIVFSAEAGSKKDITDMAAALDAVQEAVSDIIGVESASTDPDTGDLIVMYDPTVAPWKRWYGPAITAITQHYNIISKNPVDVITRTVPEQL
jgi:hypothetical protein